MKHKSFLFKKAIKPLKFPQNYQYKDLQNLTKQVVFHFVVEHLEVFDNFLDLKSPKAS